MIRLNDPILERKIRKFFNDPLNISWIVLALLLLIFLVFFDNFKQYFLRIALIGLFFALFYWLDGTLFASTKENVRHFFLKDPFAKRWKAFPAFLLEIYLIYFFSLIVQSILKDHITPDMLKRWHVVVWMIAMFAFYQFGMRKR